VDEEAPGVESETGAPGVEQRFQSDKPIQTSRTPQLQASFFEQYSQSNQQKVCQMNRST
jgi:hypothetical protein